jgi:hypothetical protein
MKAVLVTGGRDYANRARVWVILDGIGPDLLIEGGATGADRLAREWAEDHGIHGVTVPARWNKLGKSAGPARNSVMVTICRALEKTGWDVIVVAFPGGHGTASLVSIATDNQLLVRNVEDV